MVDALAVPDKVKADVWHSVLCMFVVLCCCCVVLSWWVGIKCYFGIAVRDSLDGCVVERSEKEEKKKMERKNNKEREQKGVGERKEGLCLHSFSPSPAHLLTLNRCMSSEIGLKRSNRKEKKRHMWRERERGNKINRTGNPCMNKPTITCVRDGSLSWCD